MGGSILEDQERARYQVKAFAAVNSISDGIITVDNQRLVIFMNKAAEELTGWNYRDALNKNCDDVFVIVNAVTREAGWQPLKAAMQDDERYSLLPNSVLIRKDGSELAVEDSISPVHDSIGKVIGAAIVFRDVSMSRLMLMKALHRSNQDPLTDLPNRTLLQDRIQQSLLGMQRRSHMVAVLYIDVDGFKLINDSAGHSTGDMVLQDLAKRMLECIRVSDTLCRAGGDEFILLLSDVGDAAKAMQIANKLLQSTVAPFRTDRGTYSVTLSIGVATCESPFMQSAVLIDDADAAMYRSKEAGGNQATRHMLEETPHLRKRASLEDELITALERKEFLLHYQPQVGLLSRKIVGIEALLRWQTPDRGLLYPLSFIPATERNDLIIPIGQWVLREALKQQRIWRDAGHSGLLMSVNVSAVEIQHPDYISTLERILEEEHFVPGSLMIELTETVLLQAERETDVLSLLSQTGILLAIDDFGVGHSNLSYLRRFATDFIKVDRSFIEHVTTREQDRQLVRSMVGLGKNLGKYLIAEGVETQEQVDYLISIGCDQAQGYFFSRPLSGAAFGELLRPREA
jgi:diguanylate cyclase (GGDEF)-like protein/PAS domain S-box-containing protein